MVITEQSLSSHGVTQLPWLWMEVSMWERRFGMVYYFNHVLEFVVPYLAAKKPNPNESQTMDWML